MDLTELRERLFREGPAGRTLDVDDADAALNTVQGQYLQPVSKVTATATYTTAETDCLEYLQVCDLYELRYVADVTKGEPGHRVALLPAGDTEHKGVRLLGDTFFLQHMPAGRSFRFDYYQRLRALGTETSTPDIETHWHDLYWMGAAALLGNERWAPMFADRLEQYRLERWRSGMSGRLQAARWT